MWSKLKLLYHACLDGVLVSVMKYLVSAMVKFMVLHPGYMYVP